MPKTGSQLLPANTPVAHNPQHDGWNLQWRKSPQLQPTVAVAPSTSSAAAAPANEQARHAASQAEVFSQPPQSIGQASGVNTSSQPAVRQVSSLRPVDRNIDLAEAPVARTAWAQPQFGLPENAPIPAEEPNAFQVPVPQADDFFSNPFGDDAKPAELPAPAPPAKQAAPALKADSRSMDDLRNDLRRELNAKQPMQGNAPLNPPAKKPQAPLADDGPSLREMLQRERPDNLGDADTDSPSDREEQFDNPFPKPDAKSRAADEEKRSNDAYRPGTPFGSEDDNLKRRSGLTCEEFRQRIADQSIRDVSLDISPPFRPDVIAEDEYQKLKQKFDEKQETRQWRSIAGLPLASGRLVDLAYEKAVVRTEYGSTEELPINRLSEADLAYIADNWGLPSECLIEQVAYTPRTWTKTTMTWKASNLCHKPLYFEEVNLERYGHTAGPFLQPVVSSAHFFANIAVMPYKMGIHPPSECQYALGYYRPGNCAPWIVPPIPLSLRGGLTQAAAMTGAFWLIP